MTDPREVRHRDARHVGRRVMLFDSLPSTNDYAATLAGDQANAGTVVVADFQDRGRGQYGRVWQSRPGASLLLSVLLFPPTEVRRPVILTAWAAVAVGEAVRSLTGILVRIKWPNDLLVRGKKVCGILIEQGRGTVVGIGLNLNQSHDEFAEAGLPDAASLCALGGKAIDPGVGLETVLHHLDEEYARLVGGEIEPLESDWKWRVGLLGRNVVAELADGTTATGRLLEMGFDALVLRGPEDTVRVLTPETVRHVREGVE